MRIVGVVLLVVGLVALAAGVVYFTVPANKLPAVMGHLAHVTGHRTKRGIAGLVGGVVLVVIAALALRRSRA